MWRKYQTLYRRFHLNKKWVSATANCHFYNLPSVFCVFILAIIHSCWLYVDNFGVFIINGPVAISLKLVALFSFGRMEMASTAVVSVIGGPETENYAFSPSARDGTLPARPMKTVNPKQAKNRMKIITNSLLFIEYRRICTDLKARPINPRVGFCREGAYLSQRSWW